MTIHPVVRQSYLRYHTFRTWRIGSIALVAALLISSFAFSVPPPARAASLETVGETASYYVDTAMYNLGKGNLYTAASIEGANEARHDNGSIPSACSNGQYIIYAILDFGRPFSGTVQNWINGAQVSTLNWSQIEGITLAYANSWYSLSYNCFRLHLVMGVNNEVCSHWWVTSPTPDNDPCVLLSAGNLAKTVEAANASLASSGQSWQVDISGGIDAETDPDFGSYAVTLEFANGYNSTIEQNYPTPYQLFDFGDATRSCNLDWGTPADNCAEATSKVYQIAWAGLFDYPFPEAYSTGQNTNWLYVSQYAQSHGGIIYSTVLLDGSDTWCSSIYACWQDFANKNSPWIGGGILAGSIQQPLG